MENSVNRDPHLSDALSADYAALLNDLEQARGLAGDYQSQLSDKSNDLAMLKIVLERTTTDLKNLQANILALRQERHRLANQAMNAVAFEAKLNTVTAERNQLKLENDALHKALERARQGTPRRDAQRSNAVEAPLARQAPAQTMEDRIDIPFADDAVDILIYPSPQETRSKKLD